MLAHRRAVALIVLACCGFVLASGCAKKKHAEAAPPARTDDAKVDRATPAPAATPTPAATTTPPAAKPKLQITLRSTPSGADTQVDGQPHGATPVTVDLDDDGKEHEFTFLLAGYGMERYRTSPLKSGVIHARMKPVASDADAAP